jgi:hypothetical protein
MLAVEAAVEQEMCLEQLVEQEEMAVAVLVELQAITQAL